MAREGFRVGISADLMSDPSSSEWPGLPLARLAAVPGLSWEYFAVPSGAVDAEQADSYDAIILNGPRIGAEAVESATRLGLIARFGVGVDGVDVASAARRGILVTNTPDAVRAPVASAVLCLILALAHRLHDREDLVRSGNWAGRSAILGRSVSNSVIGIIGFGGIARELVRLLEPFGTRIVVSHPRLSAADLAAFGAELVDLPTLLSLADFVVPLCPLTPETFHLLGAPELELMRPSAYLVNTSRGAIVDEGALVNALRSGSIAGAGLDVFDPEPPDSSDGLFAVDNVILTAHSLAWTEQMMADMGAAAVDAVVDVALGRVPAHVVDGSALRHPEHSTRRAHFAQRAKELL